MSEGIQITPELMAGFLDEAPEYLGTLDAQLMEFEIKARGGSLSISDADDQQRMTEMFRAAHSLKGLAAAMGFDKIREVTHLMETFFDQLRMGKREFESQSIEALFAVFDRLRHLINELTNPPSTPVEIGDVLDKLNHILAPAATAIPAATVAEPLPISIADPDLFAVFVDSTTETLDALNQYLLKLEHDGQSLDLVNEIFRAAHTLKGASGAVGCTELYRLTHDMETVLDELRGNCLTINEELATALFAALDRIRSDVDYIRTNMREPESGRPVVEYFARWLESTPSSKEQLPSTARPDEQIESANNDTDGIVVEVTFEKGFIEAPIQAYLIFNKLGEMGKVIRTEPDIDSLDGSSDVENVRYSVQADVSCDAIENVIRNYSAKSVRVSRIAPPPTAPAQPASTVVAEPAIRPPASPDRSNPAPAPTSGGQGQAVRPGETIRVDLDRLDELMNLGGELVINSARFHQIGNQLSQVLSSKNHDLLVDEADDRLQRLRAGIERLASALSPDGRPASQTAGGKGNGTAAEPVRLLSDMATDASILAHGFGEIRQWAQRVQHGHIAYRDFGDALHTLSLTSSKIQKSIMATRMVPIGPLFQRFRRVVRDIAKQTGKEVELQLHGESTELDKRMIDELGDPLTHMIRNSVDHGIEMPQGRRDAGKPPVATVRLNAYHRGRHICIEVADDGRGINLAAVRNKILDKQMATPAQVAQMSDKALIQYIFKPGFSTAEKVTDLSGRGMGMDIVVTKLEALNGTVEVDSTPGQGTVVTIKLPLTMAIITALLAKVCGQTIAIPLEAVSEIITVKPDQVQSISHHPVIRIRDAVTPLTGLESLFGGSAGMPDEVSAVKQSHTVVILVMQKQRLGLRVDELLGQQDVVIKSIATNYHNVPAIAGASIMGDGSISLILDVAAFMEMSRSGRAVPAGQVDEVVEVAS